MKTILPFIVSICLFGCCPDVPKPNYSPNQINVTVYSNHGEIIEQFKCCDYSTEHNFFAAEINYDIKICSWMKDCDKWRSVYSTYIKRPMTNTKFNK